MPQSTNHKMGGKSHNSFTIWINFLSDIEKDIAFEDFGSFMKINHLMAILEPVNERTKEYVTVHCVVFEIDSIFLLNPTKCKMDSSNFANKGD